MPSGLFTAVSQRVSCSPRTAGLLDASKPVSSLVRSWTLSVQFTTQMSSLLLASAFRRFPTIALHHSSKSASVLLLPKTCGNPSVLLARVSRLNTGVCLSKESSMASIYEFDLKKEVERDVLLYQHRRQGHFKMVQGFAFIQVLLWVYLGSFCAMYLLPGPSPEEEQKRILEKDESLKESMGFKVLLAISDFAADYRKVLAILFFICGYGIFAACSMYTTRFVNIDRSTHTLN